MRRRGDNLTANTAMENDPLSRCSVCLSKLHIQTVNPVHRLDTPPDWSSPNLFMLQAALKHERLEQVLDILQRPSTDLDRVRRGHGTGTGLPFLEAIGCREHTSSFLDRLLATEPAQTIIRLHNDDVNSGHMPLTMACLDGYYVTVTLMLKHGVRSRGSSEEKILWFLCYRLGETDANSATFRTLLTAAEVALDTGADANVSGTMGTYPLEGAIQNPVHFDHRLPVLADDLTRHMEFIRKLCSATSNVNTVGAFGKLIVHLEILLTHKYDTPCVLYSRSMLMLPIRLWSRKMRIFLDAGALPDALRHGSTRNPFQLLVSCLSRAHRLLSDLFRDWVELDYYRNCLDLVLIVYSWLVPHAGGALTYQVQYQNPALPQEALTCTIGKLMDIVLQFPDLYLPFLETYLDHLDSKKRLGYLADLEVKIRVLEREASQNTALFGGATDLTEVCTLNAILFRLRSPSTLLYLSRCRILRTFVGRDPRQRISALSLPTELRRYMSEYQWITEDYPEIRVSVTD